VASVEISERLAALDVSAATFAQALAGVEDEHWSHPSVNPGWTVRDLVNHVVGGNRRYVLLLDGAPTSDVEALRDLDHLAADPWAAFRSTAAELAAAFRGPGRLDHAVHHRLGDRPGSDLLVMRILENALHGWDLARSVGGVATIDRGVAATALAAIEADPTLLPRSGYPIRTHDDRTDDPERLLLTVTGRTG
jgi:uncharacterized protein (TIGR03086 family)